MATQLVAGRVAIVTGADRCLGRTPCGWTEAGAVVVVNDIGAAAVTTQAPSPAS